MELCGLVDVRDRVIGHLSKGYRQRVGLADTLVHKPPVLILDEPTVGLDPAQIVEVRGLIKKLAEENTVLLSTHYLAEVEQICDWVVIIHRGRIVASDSLENLCRRPDGTQASLEEVFMRLTSVEEEAGQERRRVVVASAKGSGAGDEPGESQAGGQESRGGEARDDSDRGGAATKGEASEAGGVEGRDSDEAGAETEDGGESLAERPGAGEAEGDASDKEEER